MRHIIIKRRVDGPSVPELGTPTAVTFDSVTVPLARASTGPSAIASYTIERATAAAGPWTVAATGALIFGNPPTQYVDGGRLALTTYYYRAKAQDSAGRISAYSATVSGTTTAASGFGFSWNPGFYVFNQQIAYPASSSGSVTDGYTDADLDEIAAMSAVKGWSQYATWGKLEGTRGDYSAGFTWLDSLLAKCAARGKRLCITIVASSYGGLYRYPDTYPSYITTESGAAGGVYLKESPYSGVTIKWWNAAVMDRFIAMLQAYAARYNDSAYFEGVHLMWETDLGFDPSAVSTDYSDSAYETQLTRMISGASAAFTRKNVWLRSNSSRLPTTMETLIAACHTYGVGVGGPDIYPQMAALDGQTKRELTWADEVMRGYRWNGSAHVPGGTDYRGLISRGTHAEAPAWSSWNSNSYGPFSPQNMNDQAFTNYQSHIFFLKKTWAEGTGNETFWNTGTYPQIKTWLNVTAPGVTVRSGFPTRYAALGRSPVTGGT